MRQEQQMFSQLRARQTVSVSTVDLASPSNLSYPLLQSHPSFRGTRRESEPSPLRGPDRRASFSGSHKNTHLHLCSTLLYSASRPPASFIHRWVYCHSYSLPTQIFWLASCQHEWACGPVTACETSLLHNLGRRWAHLISLRASRQTYCR